MKAYINIASVFLFLVGINMPVPNYCSSSEPFHNGGQNASNSASTYVHD